jgi:transglutaminase-like putative cysteine protease
MEASTSTLYAAPEPVEVSADARLEARGVDDQVSLTAREASYTVVSLVPAVNESMLRELPSWVVAGESGNDGGPLLPEAMEIHLALPESVTERTRALSQQLVEGQPTDYDKALAIEQYLRQYVYDLEVSEPPDDVTDVADYFLFELQRGYCDYYATAFVVLARLAGLPARFATGFTAGQWNAVEGVWVISEGDAHSWPEVYFPDAGWIPFEPTAGRASLVRTALPQFNSNAAPPPVVPAAPVERDERRWDWQQVVWLVPILVVLWGAVMGWQWWQRRREDPWHAILKWGSRIGRPMDAGETVLEYGEGLAGFVLHRQTHTPDAGRIAAREIQAVSLEVNRMHYGRIDERPVARRVLEERWQRLRSYLPLVRFS